MLEEINLMSFLYPRFKFSKGHKILLFEAFSGIGCQRMALKRITDNYESVGISEIDEPAIKSYEAIHGDCKNFGSITDIHRLPTIDIFTWSFPCTDLSKSGKQKGLNHTRSGLCYEVLRILQENQDNLPRVLIMENVIDLIQVKFIQEFNLLSKDIEKLGYTNTTFVCNAKDYGIPQTRERVFMVSILSDYQEYYYEIPHKIPLRVQLKDLFEDNVDEKYYLSKKKIEAISNWKAQQKPLENMIDKDKKYCQTLTARGAGEEHSGMVLVNESKPKVLGGIGEKKSNNGTQWYQQDRVYDNEIAISFTSSFQPNYLDNEQRIRKLTPREAGRLMGVSDEDITKMLSVSNDRNAYKQFGNGIVVDVFEQILRSLIEE